MYNETWFITSLCSIAIDFIFNIIYMWLSIVYYLLQLSKETGLYLERDVEIRDVSSLVYKYDYSYFHLARKYTSHACHGTRTAEQTDPHHSLSQHDLLICSHLNTVLMIYLYISNKLKVQIVSSSVLTQIFIPQHSSYSINPHIHVWDNCLIKYQQVSHPTPTLQSGFNMSCL